jgi:hypothetical protein
MQDLRKALQDENFDIKEYNVSELILKQEYRSNRKYPFSDMQIGQGFQINKMTRGKVYAAARTFMDKFPDIKIDMMRDKDDNIIMVRTK